MMCRVLSVSLGYYKWFKRPVSKQVQANAALLTTITEVFNNEKQRVGSPRITKRLQLTGITVGKNRVAKIMRKSGLRAKGVKKFKATTNGRHNLPVAPNLLQQNFEAKRANEKWVSDITYI